MYIQPAAVAAAAAAAAAEGASPLAIKGDEVIHLWFAWLLL